MRIQQKDSHLSIYCGVTQLWIDLWGKDSVRMTNEPVMDGHDWALTEEVPEIAPSSP